MRKSTFAELGRVEAIRQLFEGSGYRPFEEPLHYETENGNWSATASKLLLEGMDFNLVYFPLKHLGYKSATLVTGELYAVMAHPQTLNVNLGVSSKLDFEQIQELWSGITTAAREHGYKSLSLELHPSINGLAISISAGGYCNRLTGERRPEARSKDLICVSGRLGAAYFGQQVLEHKPDELEKYKMMVGEYLKPELSPSTVTQLENEAIYPSFGYMVSNGLSDAVLRLSRDSGLGAKIYADKIPFEGNSFALGKELNIDPISAAMNGGDDCKLLFTIPILQLEKLHKEFQTFDIIGHLALPEAGSVLVTPDGLEHPLTSQGW